MAAVLYLLLALALRGAAVRAFGPGSEASIEGFEVEHLPLLHPGPPPVLDGNQQGAGSSTIGIGSSSGGGVAMDSGYMFRWRVRVIPGARNVTLATATLTLTAPDHPNLPPITCRPDHPSDLGVVCGGGAGWVSSLPSIRIAAKIELTVSTPLPVSPDGNTTAAPAPAAASASAPASAEGVFIKGLPDTESAWGGAGWIGLDNANDTASSPSSPPPVPRQPKPLHRF